MFLHALVFLSWLFLCSYIVPLILLAITYASHITSLGMLAIFAYVLSLLPECWPSAAFSAILVISDRIHRNEVNAVTIAFIAFTFGGYLPVVLYAIMWNVALKNYAYKAWLATFDEDWDSNGKYKTWWWIVGINKRLMDKGIVVGRWVLSTGIGEVWNRVRYLSKAVGV